MASSSSPAWEWDADRNAYRYFNLAENRWVFSDGQKVAPAQTNFVTQGTNHPGYSSTSSSSAFGSTATGPLSTGYGNVQSSHATTYSDRSPASTAETHAASPQYRVKVSSSRNDYPHGQYYQSHPRTIDTSGYAAPESASQGSRTRRHSQVSHSVTGGYPATRDSASRTDTTVPRQTSTLHDGFQVRRPGYNFFKNGVVFKANWSEPAGDYQNTNSITTDQKFGGSVYTGIRWFVVIREGKDFSTCLRIQTFQRGGLSAGKVKNQHAIIYTGDTAPIPEQWEQTPSFDGDRLGNSIRVISNRPYDSLDPKSRINFVKLYTVEHNQKVYDFGRVDPTFEWILCTQFNYHWGIPGDQYPFSVALSQYSKNQSVPSTNYPSSAASSRVSDVSRRLGHLEVSDTSAASSDDGTETVRGDYATSRRGYGMTSGERLQYGGTTSHPSTVSRVPASRNQPRDPYNQSQSSTTYGYYPNYQGVPQAQYATTQYSTTQYATTYATGAMTQTAAPLPDDDDDYDDEDPTAYHQSSYPINYPHGGTGQGYHGT